MHKILFISFLLMVKGLLSQSPQRISYQGVARSNTGTVLSNTTIAVKFDIHQGSAGGTVVFTEQHQGADGLTTNVFGLFTTAIGSISNLRVVNWSAGPFFMEVSIDPANGTSYSSVGTQQLMSVPYALYAEKAGNATPVPTITINAPNTVTSPSTGTYSINVPAPLSYTAGNGISINNGVISNTFAASSPTITGVGQASVTSPVDNSYIVNVPTPTLSVTGGVLTGVYPTQTLTIPASSSTTLTPGNSNITLNQSGNAYTITPVTPTLNVTGGTLTGAYPSQTLTIPGSSTALVQGNNIDLIQSGNTYTISAASATLTPGNSNITLNQSGNAYTLTPVTPSLNVTGGTLTGAYPSQTLTIPSSSTALVQGNNIDLIQSGNTYTISAASATLTPGNSNIALSQSGNAYTITPVTPSLNVTGGTLTGAYPSQTLTIPSSSTTLTPGNSNITLNQSGNAYTLTPVTPSLNVTGGTLTGAYPSQTLTIPSSSTALVQGNNIDLIQSGNTYTISAASATLTPGNSNITLNQSGNAYTITPVTPSLNVTGGTLAGAYPSQTLTIPSSSTTLTPGNSNITLNQSGNAYTITPVTPSLNVTGGTLTGAYPSQTLTIPSSSTTLTPGNSNITLNQSGNAYTITPVTPSLNVTGGTLTGAYPSQTLTIPSSSTTLVAGNNISLAQNANIYTVSAVTPTLTAGANVTITPVGPANAYTISTDGPYTGTSGNIAVNGNTINLVATGITANTYGSSANNAVPYFSVDNFGRLTSAGQYTLTILGDVTGNQNASVVTKIRGINVAATTPTIGQVLQYSGSSWTPATIATPWSLTGNGGTTTSNFIGTTDNQPFRIRTNNALRAVFTESGQLMIGSGTGYGTNSKLIVEDGHIESRQTTAPSISGAGSLLGLAGSSASLSANSTDVRGTISIYTGLLGGGGKGSYATITFDKAYANPPVIILTPRSEEAAGLRAYVSGSSTTGFTLAFSTGTSGSSTYEFNYIILE